MLQDFPLARKRSEIQHRNHITDEKTIRGAVRNDRLFQPPGRLLPPTKKNNEKKEICQGIELIVYT
jgi:hypothetical protein